ncbi:MAG: hypothetical protein SAK29_26175 [Scytonema sp. PMC 1069.18]|nr:hypothetical protein [Scytonema sp. PMC 1069.18]MEC4880898.1 hypothetical protein [Scytonema sp. PMC 1070.18]
MSWVICPLSLVIGQEPSMKEECVNWSSPEEIEAIRLTDFAMTQL